MKVTVIGGGYVGLVTAACLADVGNDVICLEVDPRKVEVLRSGQTTFFEPGLPEIVQRNVRSGRLQFTTEQKPAINHGVFLFIAVGTPPGEDGSADLQHVLSAARAIGTHMDGYKVIVNKSTVPIGTGDKVEETVAFALRARGVDHAFDVVSNPEFLKEGAAVEDFTRPDRIVIGSNSERAIDLARELYAPFHKKLDRLLVMDRRSAELTKYAANAMLATRISFMNELALLAEKIGADIEMVRRGIGSDPRIGPNFLYPGCGYGGSCFPKDVSALQRTAQIDAGMDLQVLDAVQRVNDAQRHLLAEKVKAKFGSDLRGRRFCVWGLAFKPNTDDMREAPSSYVIADLVSAGAKVAAYDPEAGDQARTIYRDSPAVHIVSSPFAALDNADALIIVTEWKEFRSPDFDVIRRSLANPVIFDGRNLYDPATMRAAGFDYFCVGRGER